MGIGDWGLGFGIVSTKSSKKKSCSLYHERSPTRK